MNLGPDTEDVVGVIVYYKNKILVVKGSGGGKWSFPKGRRRERETHLQGAVREAREEAGIDLTPYEPNMELALRYGTYYLYNLRELPELTLPSTPEEIEQIGLHNYHTLKNCDKNADLRYYFGLSRHFLSFAYSAYKK